MRDYITIVALALILSLSFNVAGQGLLGIVPVTVLWAHYQDRERSCLLLYKTKELARGR